MRWKFLTETLELTPISGEVAQDQTRSLHEWFTQQLGMIPQEMWILIVIASISGFAMRVVFSFMVVYSVEIIGLTTTEWGFLGTVVSLISTVLTLPAGSLTDRIGRKPCIIISRILSPISILGFTVASTFWQLSIFRAMSGAAQGFGGIVWGVMGGPAWQALVADVTPPKNRGRMMGMMGTISGIVGTPASWIGGYMYDNISPNLPFQISFLLDLVGTGLFIAFIKEPKKPEIH
jgi:MFS family permease